MGVKDFVDEKIASAPVVVFSKSYCPFCKTTKQLFAQLGVEIVVIEMDNRDDCQEMQDYLMKITGGRSVPRVFVGGKSVGGNDDTHDLHRRGGLVPMIQAAGGTVKA